MPPLLRSSGQVMSVIPTTTLNHPTFLQDPSQRGLVRGHERGRGRGRGRGHGRGSRHGRGRAPNEQDPEQALESTVHNNNVQLEAPGTSMSVIIAI